MAPFSTLLLLHYPPLPPVYFPIAPPPPKKTPQERFFEKKAPRNLSICVVRVITNHSPLPHLPTPPGQKWGNRARGLRAVKGCRVTPGDALGIFFFPCMISFARARVFFSPPPHQKKNHPLLSPPQKRPIPSPPRVPRAPSPFLNPRMYTRVCEFERD